MEIGFWAITALVVWLVWAFVARWLSAGPRGDFETGLAWRLSQVYVRVVHGLRVEGLEHIPHQPARLIVVANHTAGVDPILIQSACPFFIRWLMALDMRLPTLEWLWTWVDVISVDRDGREIAAAREAIRYVAGGGVVGIFPEGTLERPHRTILPFLPGVGLIVHRTGAPVLPVLIEGTPQVDPAWTSLWRTSRARIRFLPAIDYGATAMHAGEITADLRARFIAASGWPVCDNPDPTTPGGKGK
ncbi:MAG: 1-acyl-sn-glycerol-3-phosphate acyltransferase [Phycisphaerales bacterium]|nr:1-acyl-sn-glycerol-3-phosphate acyltransferase [Phycisphaerales bacterium]